LPKTSSTTDSPATSPDRDQLFAWRVFIDDTGPRGVNCAIFSNRGAGLLSDLIRATEAVADQRWPGKQHYTYVDPTKVERQPGILLQDGRAGDSWTGREARPAYSGAAGERDGGGGMSEQLDLLGDPR
jgi:hypothetical protein